MLAPSAARKRYAVRPAGYAQLNRLDLQDTGELGDYRTAEEGGVMLSCEVSAAFLGDQFEVTP
jgi:hypothetical protein